MKVHVLHKSVVLIVFQKYILDILLIEGTRVRGHLGLPIPADYRPKITVYGFPARNEHFLKFDGKKMKI